MRHRETSERGTGLLEVVLAFLVLAIMAAPISYVLVDSLKQAAAARHKVAAVDVAERWIETLSTQGPPLNTTTSNIPRVGVRIPEGSTTMPTGGRKYTVQGGLKYFVTAEFSWATQFSTHTCRVVTSPNVLNVVVTVTWGNTAALSINESGNLSWLTKEPIC